jgi:hypothetical protein
MSKPDACTNRTVSFMRVMLPIVALMVVHLPTRTAALVLREADGTRVPGCGLFHPNPRRIARSGEISSEASFDSPGGKFVIRYDITGVNAVPPADLDGDGVPDWVETVAATADSVLAEFAALGYDDGLNIAGRYPIVLRELVDYGYAYPSPPELEIDNDYAESNYENQGIDGLRVTVAHELFHSVQFSYYNNHDARWWQEATSTYMEDVLYPDINDYWQYLDPRWFNGTMFENPSKSLHFAGSSRDPHKYGAAVFCHYLDQAHPEHGAASIRSTFDRQKTEQSAAIDVIVDAIEEETSIWIGDLLSEFWIWSYFSGSRTLPGQFFTDAVGYISPPPSGLTESDWVVQRLSHVNSVIGEKSASNLGASIVRIVPDGNAGGVRIDLTTVDGLWAWRVAVLRENTVEIIRPVSGRIEVPNWDTATDIVLVGANGAVSSSYATPSRFLYEIAHDGTLVGPQPERVRVDLAQNRPNPFNPTTTLDFTLSDDARATLRVYDITGRVVRTLVKDKMFTKGINTTTWDGLSDIGASVSSGVYIVRLSTGSDSESRRMVLRR